MLKTREGEPTFLDKRNTLRLQEQELSRRIGQIPLGDIDAYALAFGQLEAVRVNLRILDSQVNPQGPASTTSQASLRATAGVEPNRFNQRKG